MATYKLTPSSWDNIEWVTDPTNAYTDTSSNTYAGAMSGEGASLHLGGFNFSTIPSSESADSIDIKVKAYCDSGALDATVYSSPSGVALSNTITLGTSYAQVYTFTLTASIGTILANKSTLCIRFVSDEFLESVYVYGAEVNITTVTQKLVNKIIYGGNTLIDLTSDTVTAADVASGVTFHLPNGGVEIGTLVASPTSANKATTSTTVRMVSFTELTKEPSYFWIMPMIASATRSYRVMCVVYNGTTTYTMYTDGSSAGKLVRSTSVGEWTYSSGTLKFYVASPAYLGEATWYIWYL